MGKLVNKRLGLAVATAELHGGNTMLPPYAG